MASRLWRPTVRHAFRRALDHSLSRIPCHGVPLRGHLGRQTVADRRLVDAARELSVALPSLVSRAVSSPVTPALLSRIPCCSAPSRPRLARQIGQTGRSRCAGQKHVSWNEDLVVQPDEFVPTRLNAGPRCTGARPSPVPARGWLSGGCANVVGSPGADRSPPVRRSGSTLPGRPAIRAPLKHRGHAGSGSVVASTAIARATTVNVTGPSKPTARMAQLNYVWKPADGNEVGRRSPLSTQRWSVGHPNFVGTSCRSHAMYGTSCRDLPTTSSFILASTC